VLAQPQEAKFRRLRPGNATVARVLFPEALAILKLAGFQHDGDWLELPDAALAALPDLVNRLGGAQLERQMPAALRVALFSGCFSILSLLQGRTVCKQWRREAQDALQFERLNLPRLLEELCFNGWFSLRCAFTDGDPIADFHSALFDQPLTCYAGGDMRLQRAQFVDISRPDSDAFLRLNPWEMLKVGPFGLKPTPDEPRPEWWAKLNALVSSASVLRGRQWHWSERSSMGGTARRLHIRHLIYCLSLGTDQVTVTMRAIWDSTGA